MVFCRKNLEAFSVETPILTEKLDPMNPYILHHKNNWLMKKLKRVEELKGFYGNLISTAFYSILMVYQLPNFA